MELGDSARAYSDRLANVNGATHLGDPVAALAQGDLMVAL